MSSMGIFAVRITRVNLREAAFFLRFWLGVKGNKPQSFGVVLIFFLGRRGEAHLTYLEEKGGRVRPLRVFDRMEYCIANIRVANKRMALLTY